MSVWRNTSNYVEDGFAGTTELRVHGVSGTTPEGMLQHAGASRVAGDGVAGFYRRSWDAARVSADSSQQRMEAYSWGGLTSGGWSRSLWLMLMPFMLVNVAHYMNPPPPSIDPDSRRGKLWQALARIGVVVEQLFALTLTWTMVMSAITLTMDLVGWQCGRQGAACHTSEWFTLIGWPWQDVPERRVAVASLGPIVLVLLLWWLGHRTWAVAEATPVGVDASTQPPAAGGRGARLEDRALWNGAGPVARLRELHITAALSLIGLFLSTPLLVEPHAGWRRLVSAQEWSGGRCFPVAMVWCFLTLLAGCAAPMLISFEDRRATATVARRRHPYLIWVATALLGVAWVANWWSSAWFDRPEPGRRATTLPWLADSSAILFAIQFCLIVVMAATVYARVRISRGGAATSTTDKRPAWHGMAPVVLSLTAWVIAGGLGAALTLRLASSLGRPVAAGIPHDEHADNLVLPVQYFWTADAAVALLVCLLLSAGFAWLLLRRERQTMIKRVAAAYDRPEKSARTMQIGRIWSEAHISDQARHAVGLLSFLVFVVLAAGTGGYLWLRDEVMDGRWHWLSTIGSTLVAAAVLALLYIGRQAYRNPRFRRTVGILWDVGTFWPRVVHPLAPPCYAERTIPDLMVRIAHTGSEGGRVVLSCHSQGTVIGLAALAALAPKDRPVTALLTYGSPLRRIYARFFPAYFSATELATLRQLIGDRWVNLYRSSDPIGGAVFGPDHHPSRAAAESDSDDRYLLDPAYARPPGDPCFPAASGHSDYFADPAFAEALGELRERLIAGA